MSWTNSVPIHLGFWLYLFAGGQIYFQIENSAYLQPPSPKQSVTINSTFCLQLGNFIVEKYRRDTINEFLVENANFSLLLAGIRESCNNFTVAYHSTNNSDRIVLWEYSSALFLCMTILTTIGYGNYSPKTDRGKLFCIVYGFIGIPICGLFLASTTNYFSNIFLNLYESQKARHKDKRNSILLAALVFLLPGLAVFLFVPSALFMVIEGWDYLDAVYFSFASITTIGLGDIVAAQRPSELLWLYRICTIIWITLGIAYWAIIITFIMKSIKSQELSKRWDKTIQAIAKQAKEIRRIMLERQNSPYLATQDADAFLALKTKAAVEFAIKLSGSIGNLGDHSLNVKTVFQPQYRPTEDGFHFHTIKEFYGTQFNEDGKQLIDNLHATHAKEKAEISPQSTCRRRPSLIALRNTLHSINTDPNCDGRSESVSTESSFDVCVDMTPRQTDLPQHSIPLRISTKENSRISLPSTLDSNEAVAISQARQESNRRRQYLKKISEFLCLDSISQILTSILHKLTNPWKLYENHKTRITPPTPPTPKNHETYTQLADLLMEALMILQEVVLTGSNFTTVEE